MGATSAAGGASPGARSRGYRIENGPSACSRAQRSSPINSALSLGAVTVMFGTASRYAMSYRPMCVWPSSPTMPARSRQNSTGSRWIATSWMMLSYARCRNVE